MKVKKLARDVWREVTLGDLDGVMDFEAFNLGGSMGERTISSLFFVRLQTQLEHLQHAYNDSKDHDIVYKSHDWHLPTFADGQESLNCRKHIEKSCKVMINQTYSD